jgi:TetR/AcrR family transcriptional repressor of lmrAB and yxaGH operons
MVPERASTDGPRAERPSREAFLDATALLLRRQGYNATAINAIVARSGAPKGSLYFHFPGGKEQLAVEAMARSGEQLRRAIVAIVSGADPAADRPGAAGSLGDALGRLVDAMAAGLQGSGYADGCPIATVTLEAATGSDAVRSTADAVFTSWLIVLEERLVASGMEPARAQRRALFVLAALEGALILARARRDTEPLSAVREELVALTHG